MHSKKILFTSVAVLNTLASVAVPTVASAETIDSADTNIKTEAPANDQVKADAPESSTPVDDSNQMVDNNINNNQGSTILDGSKDDKPDKSVAHNAKLNEFVNLPTSRMSNNEFLNIAGPMAQRAAHRYNLYASVMIAQSIIESGWGKSTLAMAPNYNLFGIKGSYNGQSVYMWTQEYGAGGYYYINAAFRKYPSYEQSFNDNGSLLRNSSLYSGTWRERTSSYRDATRWLQGRYATAPNYASVLNNTIVAYNLTRFDVAPDEDLPINGTFSEMDDIAKIETSTGAPIYKQARPDKPSGRVLSKGSEWLVTGKVVTPTGDTYIRVSNKEYIRLADTKLRSDVPVDGTYTSERDTGKITNDNGAQIYTQAHSEMPSKRKLSNNTEWRVTGKVVTKNNEVYYQVSTKEYIKASDMKLYTEYPVNGKFEKLDDIATITNANGGALYIQANFDLPSRRSFDNGSKWKVTGKVVTPDGDTFYQVSSKEFLNANDVQLESDPSVNIPTSIININNPDASSVPLVGFTEDGKMVKVTRGLANDTYWATSRTREYKGHTYYRVSTNEWVVDTYATISK